MFNYIKTNIYTIYKERGYSVLLNLNASDKSLQDILAVEMKSEAPNVSKV
jgi:hypothetical protein